MVNHNGLDVCKSESNEIRERLTRSKEFVNIFLENTPNKSDTERVNLFNILISNVANTIEFG